MTQSIGYTIIHGEGGSVNLEVQHACGHIGKYSYGGAEYALADVSNQQKKICSTCHNEAEIARHQAEKISA